MKKLLFAWVFLLGIDSCTDHEPVYRVDDSLQTYVDLFYAEAQERGVEIPRNLIADHSGHRVQGVTYSETRNGQNYLYVTDNIIDGRILEYSINQSLGGLFAYKKVVFDSLNQCAGMQYVECVPTTYEREAFFSVLFQ